jgi:hypothetical protein
MIRGRQGGLFKSSGWGLALDVAAELERNHYLGPAVRGWSYRDEFGCLIVARPTSRRIPLDWLELTRWCLVGTKNGGSQQWARVRRDLLSKFPDCSTVVSYSDPSQGHTGALYRACGWKWAPTWHRIVTPPTGNGSWVDGVAQAAKDRWVYPLRPDPKRADLLRLDESYVRRFPWAEYREPAGADYKEFQRLARPGDGM